MTILKVKCDSCSRVFSLNSPYYPLGRITSYGDHDQCDECAEKEGKRFSVGQEVGEIKKTWNCRFHPTEGFHEVGCPHTTEAWAKKWGAEYISLCPSCNCMTHTINGVCGKCKEVKAQ